MKNIFILRLMTLRYVSVLTILLTISIELFAQKKTVAFAQRDTQTLKMDIYKPAHPKEKNPCVIFAFGGGFFTGSRDSKLHEAYFTSLVDSGFIVASIDYRLGLKDSRKPPSLFNRKPLMNAIEMAVEDLFEATKFLIDHAADYDIDTSMIIASGSSAGAITVLTADYRKRNHQRLSNILPKDFQYASVVAFAGAIYSKSARPKYEIAPAPMLLFHGNEDDVVPFNKKAMFGTGLYGSRNILLQFKKNNHPYTFYVMDRIGHDAAEFPMRDFLPEIHEFIRKFIFDKRPLYINILLRDENRKNSNMNFSEIYKKRKS